MMIRDAELDQIEAGTVDLAFRRWDRPRVRVGTRLRTRVGLVEITSVVEVDPAELDESDARRAGAASRDALLGGLAAHPDRPVWRVGVRHAGPDPREQLRTRLPTPDEVEQLQARLDRLDRAAAGGPWTAVTLRLIDAHPGRRAPDLAAEVGRETAPFKTDVRKLKELGLTESLAIGYRLSPRGEVVVDAARRRAGEQVPRRTPRPEGTPLPRDIGAPATRALRERGVAVLDQLAGRDHAEVASWHGVGPVALRRLARALDAAGLAPLRGPADGPA